ncbi:MAG: hypothetical protein NTV40_00100 [Solirubrobacterales bacterium]|nr:hypothetical protein [Solirubrobacterales bacterium]
MGLSSFITIGISAALLGAPAVAVAAPTVSVEKGCWNSASTLEVVGSGYRPKVAFKLLLNGRVASRGITTTTGDISGIVKLPRISRASGQRSFEIRLTDGRRTATRRIFATAIWADYEPAVTSLRQRVTFSGNGFGPNKTLFLHYVSPSGKLRRTLRLGESAGVCGRLEVANREVFDGFTPEAGRWRLQFDTRATYVRGPRPSVTLAVTIVKAASPSSHGQR